MVYSSQGFPFELSLGKISGVQLQSYWYEPKTGKSIKGDLITNKGIRQFVPPSQGYGNDWVLVLDDAGKKFAELMYPGHN